MSSVIPLTERISTSSATLKAACRGRLGTTSKRRSFGTTITVSETSRSLFKPASAFCILIVPSALKGMVTMEMVRAPASRAASATTGEAPVPVPPPRPQVTKTMSAPSTAALISSISS
ncbi:MAG: hypothetical protein A4E43_01561 [Methanosaeta sp. PtaB.Bin005]|nr:MAG: hypothetical protein A4E43_01561 [Methanosaeta sp. PtaB.Bin005]